MAALIRAYDWETTPLGPIDRWPQSLKAMVDLMLASPGMMSLVWGADATHLYNDAFTELLREHPVPALGRSAYETFAGSRDVFAADIAAGMAGKSARSRSQRYPVLRNAQLEEAWFDVDYAPVRDDTGQIAGVLWTLTETTAQVVAERAVRESEARHRLLVESWAQAVWETNAEGVVVADSPSWRAYTGQTVEQWLGYGWLDAIHPDDRAFAERQWRAAMAMCGVVDAEFRLRSPDGGWRWTNDRAFPMKDEAGAIQKWVGMNVDIDARKRAEMALQESEQKYRSLFATVRQGLAINQLVRDEDGRVVDARYLDLNPAYEAQTGFDRAQAIGHLVSEIFPLSEPLWLEMAERVVESGRPERIERFVADTGSWFAFDMAPFDQADRFIVLFDDITERKQAEQALRESEERQAFLLELSDAIRPLVDAADVQATATRLLGEHLHADRSMYAEVSGEPGAEAGTVRGQYIRTSAQDRPAPKPFPDHFTYETFGADVMARRYNGEGLAVADVNANPGFDQADRAAWAAAGVQAAIVAPLVKGGRLVAEVGVHSETARIWTDAEILLVREVGERTWAAAERALAESALRESEERYRSLFESMDEAYAVIDVLKDETGAWADFRFVEVNPAFIAHTSMPWPVGQTATELLGSPNPRWTQLYGQTLDSGKAIRIEETEPALDRTFDLNIFTLDRSRNRVAVLFTNITERKAAEAALHDSEQWLQTLMKGVPQLVWRAVDSGHWTWASPQWTAFTGQAQADSHGWGWLEPVHPDDRETVKEKWAKAIERGEFEADYRIRHAGEDRHRWFQSRATPVRDEAGTIIEWLGTSTDVDDLRALQERQRVLLAELQHRVRNILAVTRSIISRSDDGERSTQEYVSHLQGRIAALARTQVLLTRQAGTGINVEDMIRDELLAQIASEDQFTLSGPEVELSAKAAEVLTLAVHELATNATKYGAFSRDTGRLAVEWKVETRDGQRWLSLSWTERGVPIVDAVPRRQGLGSELISRRIPYELKGTGSFALRPGGLHSHIEFPLSAGDSILQTNGVS